MPFFAYTALNKTGARSRGQVEAIDENAALDALAAKGLTPVAVSAGTKQTPWWNRDISLSGWRQSLKDHEIATFLSGMAAMLDAKTPLPRALKFCADLTSDSRMKEKILTTLSAVENGTPLSEALSTGPVLFPDRLTTLIRLGEAANSLASVVSDTAEMLQREAALRRQVQQALVYPIILLLMSVFVIGVLVFYLAPTLAPVFATASSGPPFIIRMMLRVQETLRGDWPIVLTAVLVAVSAAVVFGQQFKRLTTNALGMLPTVRRYRAKRESLQLCQTLFLMLRSGGHLTEAIKLAGQMTRNPGWQRHLLTALRKIEDGQSMQEALLDHPMLDPVAATILRTGEESDQFLAVLPSAIKTLQAQTTEILAQGIRLLTPALTLLIGITVGGIILSTISAIMDLNDVVL